MSNAINDAEEHEVKKEPLVDEKLPGEVSKKKILMYYGLTVGAVLLIVIIVLIIAIALDDPQSESKSNILKCKYSCNEKKKLYYSILNLKIQYL